MLYYGQSGKVLTHRSLFIVPSVTSASFYGVEYMLYAELVKLIEANRESISRHVAQELLKQNLVTGTLAEIGLRYIPGVIAIEEYLKTNTPDQWQGFIENYTQRGIKAGYTMEFLMTIGNLTYKQVTVLIEQTYSGDANKSKRERFIRRMDSMRAFAEITMRNAKMNM
jgi:hypothetical protein